MIAYQESNYIFIINPLHGLLNFKVIGFEFRTFSFVEAIMYTYVF